MVCLVIFPIVSVKLFIMTMFFGIIVCVFYWSPVSLTLTGLEGHICPFLVKDGKDIYVQLL